MKRTSQNDWAKRVKAWKKSGKTAQEYADQIGVSPQTLYRWRGKLRKKATKAGEEMRLPDVAAACQPASLVPFVEVLPSAVAVPSATPFEVHVDRGRRITVPTNFDPESLRRLLCVIEEA